MDSASRTLVPPAPHIELKASASKGFRYPTIREMYMFPPQNPNLKPESMWSYEWPLPSTCSTIALPMHQPLLHRRQEPHRHRARQGATPLNMNTGKIDNCGVEAEVSYRIDPHWSVEANTAICTWRIPWWVPRTQALCRSPIHPQAWTVYTGVQYIDKPLHHRGSKQPDRRVCPVVPQRLVRVNRWLGLWARV